MFPPFGGIGPYGAYGNLGLYGALSAFGSLTLTEASPPQSFSEILTLAEVKSYLRLPDRSPADQAEDDELTSLIVAAREQAEILQGRDLIRKQFDLSLDYWNNYRIELRDPLASVDLFQYKDSTGAVTVMAEDTDFIVDTSRHPGFVSPPYNKTWPTFATWPSSAILIRFTSGYAPSFAVLERRWGASEERDEAADQQLVSQSSALRKRDGRDRRVSLRGHGVPFLRIAGSGTLNAIQMTGQL